MSENSPEAVEAAKELAVHIARAVELATELRNEAVGLARASVEADRKTLVRLSGRADTRARMMGGAES